MSVKGGILYQHIFMALLSLFFLLASRMLGLFMLFPVLAVLTETIDGYTPLLAGLSLGAYGLSQSLLQIPFGKMSDKYGRKKILYLGFTLFLIGSLIGTYATNIWMILVARLLQGCGAVGSVILALAVDLSPAKKRLKTMTLFGISIGLAFVVAISISPIIANKYGLSGIFALVSLLAIVSLLLVATIKEKKHSTLPNNPKNEVKFDPVIFGSAIISAFFLHYLLTLVFTIVPSHLLSTYHYPLERHAVIYLIALVVSSIGVMTLVRKFDMLQSWQTVIRISIISFAISLSFIVMAPPSFLLYLIFLFLYFSTFTLLEGFLPTLTASIMKQTIRGKILGYFATFQFIGAFLGGISGGAANQYLTKLEYCLMLIFLLLLWITLLFFMKNSVFSYRLEKITMVK